MVGFFKKEQKVKPKQKKKQKKQKKTTCEICGLYKTCQSPKIPIYGEGKKKILIVDVAPTKAEDENGKQGSSRTNHFLKQALEKYNVNLKEDCWKINAVRCYIPKNRQPKTLEINNCRKYLNKIIKKLQPEKIILLGKIPLQSFLGSRASISAIEKWIGFSIPDQDFKAWIFPIWNPNYLLIEKNQKNIVLYKKFDEYLENAIKFNREFPDFSNSKNNIRIVTDANKAIEYLKYIKDTQKLIAFDYETTGLKPHKKGHKIACVSIGILKYTVVFPFFDNKQFQKLFKSIMIDETIKKIAHSITFENKWTDVILGYEVKGWYWDTMLSTHILDNRKGICRLKFQTYLNFGILGYEDKIQEYLEANSKNCNDFNKIKEVLEDKELLNELLLYCGLDSFYTLKLYKIHKKEIKKKNLQNAFNFFMESILTLMDIEKNGVYVNTEKMKKDKNNLIKEIKNIDIQIQETNEVKKWKEKFNIKPEVTFNCNSPKQMQEILFDTLNYKVTKQTATGNNSTDQEVLESLDTKFTNLILRSKKLKKLKNTYLDGFMRETINGKIYTNFNLHTARTYRGSGSNPNMQNIPIRDKEANEITRGSIIPRKGNQIFEVDYSSIEVKLAACYNKDKNLLKYVRNSDTDMHRDQAMKIFIMDKDSITKELRQIAKNNFVFPEFYGDYYVQCATAIWKQIDKDVKKHLKKCGISSYIKFENHIKQIEFDLWNKYFYEYKQWKEEQWNKYQDTGYIDTYLGFKYIGVMNKKDVSNYPIQGTAFHCLLWSLIKLNKYIKDYNLNSMIIGQVHDSIIFDIDPKELNKLKLIIRKIMCEDIRNEFKWLIVPLDIEAEIAPIDCSWSEKKKCEI
jgi:DNA polymerase-1